MAGGDGLTDKDKEDKATEGNTTGASAKQEQPSAEEQATEQPTAASEEVQAPQALAHSRALTPSHSIL